MNHFFSALCFAFVALPSAIHAETPTKIEPPAKRQLINISEAKASQIVELLEDVQRRLKADEKQYFTLLSGAPASYDMTKVTPRDAFLQVRFDEVWEFRRVATINRLWQPFRLSYAPDGLGKLYWDIEVVFGLNDKLERVTMTYKPPAPF